MSFRNKRVTDFESKDCSGCALCVACCPKNCITMQSDDLGYMRPSWNKRFGTKFGKSFWNEQRGEWDKGSYIVSVNDVKDIINLRLKIKNLNLDNSK